MPLAACSNAEPVDCWQGMPRQRRCAGQRDARQFVAAEISEIAIEYERIGAQLIDDWQIIEPERAKAQLQLVKGQQGETALVPPKFIEEPAVGKNSGPFMNNKPVLSQPFSRRFSQHQTVIERSRKQRVQVGTSRWKAAERRNRRPAAIIHIRLAALAFWSRWYRLEAKTRWNRRRHSR